MDELEELSLLIGDIYDASLDRALWPDAFNGIRGFFGGCAASLVTQSAITKTVDLHFMAGYEQHFFESYRDKYFKINPWFPTAMFLDVERDYVLDDVLSRKEFCRTRFAKEWLAPQGLVDGVLSTVDTSARDCTVFSTMRNLSQSFADDAIRRRFNLILPHVRRALLIGKVIETHQVKAAALADSLDALASAMFIVDGTGRIVHANVSGNLMVSDGNVLRAPNGRLRANDAVADQALLDIFTSASGGDAALGKQGIAVPIVARDEERYVAHVLPMTSAGRRKAGASFGAVAAVFVRKATLDLPAPPVVIAKQFGLTQAELRVLFSVVEIGGTAEVAEVLGISEATVKTHLHHVFEKTGTGRQAELVKLVAGYCMAP